MKCRVCSSTSLAPLWRDTDGYQWHRCTACGSDTSAAEYDPTRYGGDYVTDLLDNEGPSVHQAVANHFHNADMIERHAKGKPGRTFLDVGCGHGASGAVMRSRGWAVVGWDVNATDRPTGTVIGAIFQARMFAHRFDAVLCREILEHVPEPHALIGELYAATAPGGVCEITTPRPMPTDRPPPWVCYHWAHLAVWSVESLTAELRRVGFEVLESDIWEHGQRHLCRRAG